MKRRDRFTCTAASLAMMAMVASAASVPQTQAAWTDPEYAASTQITAGSLPQPTITACTAGSVLGLLLTSVSFTWTSTLPIGMQRHYINGKQGTQLPTLVSAVNGVNTYSVTYSQGLLTTLLTVLSSEIEIKVNTAQGTNWVSPSDRWLAEKILLGTKCASA